MPRQKDLVFKLIKSLEPAEKRHFRLFVGRTRSGEEALFLKLFELMCSTEEYDEKKLREQLPGPPSEVQMANLKRHLYKQLLISLRLLAKATHIDIEIREQLDFARILYSKGHYMESLHTLERIKTVAEEHHQDILHLEILEFQKLIEARHVTRSRQVKNKLDRLLQEATQRSIITHLAGEKINLNIQIHGYYIEFGFAVTEAEKQKLQNAWAQMLPEGHSSRFLDTFFEKVNIYQASMWYRYILLDLPKAQLHAQEWVSLFDLYPAMKVKDPDLYMRSLYYLLVMLFLNNDSEHFRRYFEQMEHYMAAHYSDFTPNSRIVSFIYQGLSALNLDLLLGVTPLTEGKIEGILSNLNKNRGMIDEHRAMLFYYKCAALVFLRADYARCREYLSPLLYQNGLMQYALDINARFLELMCLYEQKELDFMDSRLASLARSMGKHSQISHLQRRTLSLLRDLQRNPHLPKTEITKKYLSDFNNPNLPPFDRYFLRYLDVAGWMAR